MASFSPMRIQQLLFLLAIVFSLGVKAFDDDDDKDDDDDDRRRRRIIAGSVIGMYFLRHLNQF